VAILEIPFKIGWHSLVFPSNYLSLLLLLLYEGTIQKLVENL